MACETYLPLAYDFGKSERVTTQEVSAKSVTRMSDRILQTLYFLQQSIFLSFINGFEVNIKAVKWK